MCQLWLKQHDANDNKCVNEKLRKTLYSNQTPKPNKKKFRYKLGQLLCHYSGSPRFLDLPPEIDPKEPNYHTCSKYKLIQASCRICRNVVMLTRIYSIFMSKIGRFGVFQDISKKWYTI